MNRNDIEQALRDYHWMPKEVERLQQILDEVDTSVTAQYGIEAAMPKAGGNQDKIGKEVTGRRDKRYRQMDKLQGKIDFVENGISLIENDLDRTVMFCVMDGLSQVGISQHLRISEGKISTIKESIVEKLYQGQFEGNEGFEGNEEKCAAR